MSTTGWDVKRAKDKGMPALPALAPKPLRAKCKCTLWLVVPASVGTRCAGCGRRIEALPKDQQR